VRPRRLKANKPAHQLLQTNQAIITKSGGVMLIRDIQAKHTEHALKFYRLRPFAKKLLGRN